MFDWSRQHRGKAFSLFLPALPEWIVDTQRGVTLMQPETKQLLSIVEHFLAAVSLSGFYDITATIEGDAPELPLLDGSALPWYQAIVSQWGKPKLPSPRPIYTVDKPLFMQGSTLKTALVALPAKHFSITYTLDYPHVGFQGDWATWQGRADERVCVEQLLSAQTFGLVAELPALQAKGLALGVTLEDAGFSGRFSFVWVACGLPSNDDFGNQCGAY